MVLSGCTSFTDRTKKVQHVNMNSAEYFCLLSTHFPFPTSPTTASAPWTAHPAIPWDWITFRWHGFATSKTRSVPTSLNSEICPITSRPPGRGILATAQAARSGTRCIPIPPLAHIRSASLSVMTTVPIRIAKRFNLLYQQHSPPGWKASKYRPRLSENG